MFDVDYIRPQDLDEALDFVNERGSDTTILAGGTDVMIDMRSGTLQNKYLLDISRLSDLREIKIKDAELTIGAAVGVHAGGDFAVLDLSRGVDLIGPSVPEAAEDRIYSAALGLDDAGTGLSSNPEEPCSCYYILATVMKHSFTTSYLASPSSVK